MSRGDPGCTMATFIASLPKSNPITLPSVTLPSNATTTKSRRTNMIPNFHCISKKRCAQLQKTSGGRICLTEEANLLDAKYWWWQKPDPDDACSACFMRLELLEKDGGDREPCERHASKRINLCSTFRWDSSRAILSWEINAECWVKTIVVDREWIWKTQRCY